MNVPPQIEIPVTLRIRLNLDLDVRAVAAGAAMPVSVEAPTPAFRVSAGSADGKTWTALYERQPEVPGTPPALVPQALAPKASTAPRQASRKIPDDVRAAIVASPLSNTEAARKFNVSRGSVLAFRQASRAKPAGTQPSRPAAAVGLRVPEVG